MSSVAGAGAGAGAGEVQPSVATGAGADVPVAEPTDVASSSGQSSPWRTSSLYSIAEGKNEGVEERGEAAAAAPSLATSIALACAAALCYGSANYLISFLVSFRAGSVEHHMGVIGLFLACNGVMGLFLLGLMRLRGVRFMETKEGDSAPGPGRLGLRSLAVLAGGGLCLSGAMICTALAFSIDPANAGPLSSVIGADVILYAVVCSAVYGERISLAQWAMALALVVGLVLIANGDGPQSSSSAADDDASEIQHVACMMWSLFAMLGFTGVNLSMRLGVGVSAEGSMVVRVLAMGLSSLPVLALVGPGLLGDLDLLELLLPVAACLLSIAGTFCLMMAFRHPATIVFVVILSTQSVVVLLLTAIVQLEWPPALAIAGMAVAVASTALFSLLSAPPEPARSDKDKAAVDDLERN